MKITIIETKEQSELSIIDAKSGTDWINDLMGNHDALPEYDDDSDSYLMSQDDFNWWLDVTTRYEAADHRYHDLLKELDEIRAEELRMKVENQGPNDLEDWPDHIENCCDEIEGLND